MKQDSSLLERIETEKKPSDDLRKWETKWTKQYERYIEIFSRV